MSPPGAIKEKICIVPGCETVFYVSARKGRGQRGINIRPKNSVTCSKECSKIWNETPHKIRKSLTKLKNQTSLK